jgi:nucleotide-binding universal stress UspA family protein
MIHFKKILIATDGSEEAKAAVSKGLELASLMNAEVTALSVLDVGSMAYAARGPSLADVYTYLEESAKAAVDAVKKEGEALGLKVETQIRKGSPGNEIIDASKDYDLIVMGSIGRGGIARLLIGSVAERVVRFASCPVLVIRKHEEPA